MDDSSQENNEDLFFIPGYKDAATYTQETLRTVITATKASNELPAAGDSYDYYSTFPGFQSVLLRKGQSILSLMTTIIQNQGMKEKFQGRELEEKYDLLVDVNDSILENISNYVDEASGLKKSGEELVIVVKPSSAINTSWNRKQFNSSSPRSFTLTTSKNITRPQLSFKDKIDNSNSVFVPIIKEKPNSIKPLAIILEKGGERDEFCHPYEWEIEKFKPHEDLLQAVDPILPKPLEETPLVHISTEEQLKELCKELKKEKEIAIDLEHHSFRTFQGITCLMQISTREKDFIVDVLKLRSELYILNEVFTDPKIVKVLHGADSDIVWLQRDFGLYIVNMFDTGQAARVLHFAHLSLSYLLKHYCKIDLDKKYQKADWRMRPLPAELIKYAREDTHYLLYVYDCLKNDLIQQGNEMKNLLYSTFERSKLICLKKYQKPLFSEDKYLDLYRNSRKIMNAKQLFCLKELYSWRDNIARQYDESVAYVLPDHMLLQIAEALPREQQGILACCNPIPPMVKQQLNELHSIILKANESSLKEHEILELQQKAQAPKVNNQIDLSNLIHCPHDILHLEDRQKQEDDIASSDNVLPHIVKNHSSPSLLKEKPILSSLFIKYLQKPKECISEKKIPLKVLEQVNKLIGPFERFKMTEELQMSTQKTAPQEEENNQSLEVIDEPSVNESDIQDNDEIVVETTEISNANESCEVIESTPIRKKKKKKRKKPEPDVSIIDTPGPSEPPQKKSCTPEVVTIDDDNGDFTPYDYSQSDYAAFSGKKNRTNLKNQKNSNQNNQKKKPFFGKKRKHAKQATFSTNSKDNSRSSRWPKNN